MIDTITNTVNSMAAFNVAVVAYIPTVIGIASVIARFLPPPEQPGIGAKIHKFINWLAQNSGYAENKQ